MSTSELKGIRIAVEAIGDHYKMDKNELYKVVMTLRIRTSPNYKRFEKASQTTRRQIADKEQAIAEHRVRSLDAANEKIRELKIKLEGQLQRLKAMGEPPDFPNPHESPKGKKAKKAKEPEAEPEAAKPELKEEEEESKMEEKKEKKSKKKNVLLKTLKENASKLKDTSAEYELAYKDDFVKEFHEYVNNMEAKDFASKDLDHHIRKFIADKATPSKEDAPKDPHADNVELASWEELKELDLESDGYEPGIYWDRMGNRFVTGADEDMDEDFTEHTDPSTNMIYQIGNNTHRVYTNLAGDNTFVGYANVGMYKDFPEEDEESESDSDDE